MAKQTVTLRLDEGDLEFLASLSLTGATSLSEKVRALLAEARLRREGAGDPAAAWDYSRRLYAGPERALRLAELASGRRSELVSRGLAALPELTAFLLALGDEPPRGNEQGFLLQAERGLGDRLLALADSIQRIAQSGFPGCIDPHGLAVASGCAPQGNLQTNQASRNTPPDSPQPEQSHD